MSNLTSFFASRLARTAGFQVGMEEKDGEFLLNLVKA
jgi:hypothetical protein